MADVTIRDIKVITTNPRGVDLVCVKVETSEPGLYGLGCATFTQRYTAVVAAINDYLKPLVIGKKVNNIQDIWQLCMSGSYWRNGPVLNNAISGIDQALWDIKGKMANMPVYELLGGKCREGVAVYRHCEGKDIEDIDNKIQEFIDQGYHYIRVQNGSYGGNMASASSKKGLGLPSNQGGQYIWSPEGAPEGAYYDPDQYMHAVVETFKHVREKFGYEVHFMHDVHERLTPIQAMQLAKDLEPYKLFFLEDALPPEQVEWFEYLRNQTTVPLAMGELFNNPMEWKEIIQKRYIDYIRVHISQIGGLTPAIKLANFCEAYGVRTAWHGPFDLTPVGAAAQLHLDLATANFGIQEFSDFTDEEREIFPGVPEVRNGYLYANDKPGFGIDINEEAAAKFPAEPKNYKWLRPRLPDGTCVRA